MTFFISNKPVIQLFITIQYVQVLTILQIAFLYCSTLTPLKLSRRFYKCANGVINLREFTLNSLT